MPITFDDEECAALKQALDYYLPQLRLVRASAEARAAQHALSLLEVKLEAIARRLEAAGAAEARAP